MSYHDRLGLLITLFVSRCSVSEQKTCERMLPLEIETRRQAKRWCVVRSHPPIVQSIKRFTPPMGILAGRRELSSCDTQKDGRRVEAMSLRARLRSGKFLRYTCRDARENRLAPATASDQPHFLRSKFPRRGPRRLLRLTYAFHSPAARMKYACMYFLRGIAVVQR